MDRDLVALLGFVGMFVLMALRVPIGVAMGIIGVLGFGALSGLGPALNLLGNVPLSVLTDYNLLGDPDVHPDGRVGVAVGHEPRAVRRRPGLVRPPPRRPGLRQHRRLRRLCGHQRLVGGHRGHDDARWRCPKCAAPATSPGFSAGLIAAGGTLGIMIPPSTIFVLYGIMTEVDIAKLFAAGVVPGPAGRGCSTSPSCSAWAGATRRSCRCGEPHSWRERFASLRDLWAVLLLFVFVLGGIYGGLFTVQEAAGIGATGTLAIGLLRRRLGWREIRAALIDALRVSSAIMMIVVGAFLFGYFLTITQFTQQAVDWLVNLPIGAYGVLALVMVGYFVLGAVMDELAMILLTVPIVFPAMMQLGFDPVWFGVIVVMAVTFGLICPPVGMNVFVINSIARDISLGEHLPRHDALHRGGRAAAGPAVRLSRHRAVAAEAAAIGRRGRRFRCRRIIFPVGRRRGRLASTPEETRP